jgi:predicted nucleic acid-binding protein
VSVVYDAGLLIAADRNDRVVWADHRARLELGVIPLTTAPVIAQVSRTARQAQLRRLLRGCHIVALVPSEAHEVGALLERAGTSDVVDAHVVVTAARYRATVITSDAGDLRRLSNSLDEPIPIRGLHNTGPRRPR